jgi:hypothetical protein
MRSRGRMLEWSHPSWPNSKTDPLTTSWSGMLSPISGWWAPSHSTYKEDVGVGALVTRLVWVTAVPFLRTLIRSSGSAVSGGKLHHLWPRLHHADVCHLRWRHCYHNPDTMVSPSDKPSNGQWLLSPLSLLFSLSIVLNLWCSTGLSQMESKVPAWSTPSDPKVSNSMLSLDTNTSRNRRACSIPRTRISSLRT